MTGMEVMDIVDMLSALSETEIDAAIAKLEEWRARATAEFDQGIRQLRSLRRSMFWSSGPKRNKTRPEKPDGPTPGDRVAMALLAMESASVAEIVANTGLTTNGVEAILRFGDGKRFKCLDRKSGVWSVMEGKGQCD